MRPMILSAIATAAAASAAPAGCCVLGGDGSGVIVGGGPLATARGAAPALTSLALGASPAAGFVAVLAGFAQTDAPPAGPEAARAGWIITRGAGGAQTLTAWAPAAGGGAGAPPVCTRDTAPAGGYVADFALCAGAGQLWDTPLQAYALPGAFSAQVWAAGGNGSSFAAFTDGGCAPLGVSGAESPLAGGAWTISATWASAAAPPPAWAVPPAACGF